MQNKLGLYKFTIIYKTTLYFTFRGKIGQPSALSVFRLISSCTLQIPQPCILVCTDPKEIDFPRYNMKCSMET